MDLKVTITVQDLDSDFATSADYNIPGDKFSSFDFIMDAEFSNIKMNCLSYVYKNHPSIWFHATPADVEALANVQLNPIYRIKIQ